VRRCASAAYAVVVCLSIGLCVCVFHTSVFGVESKRLNLGSRKQHRTIATDSFWCHNSLRNSMFQNWDYKLSLKCLWSRSCDIFNLWEL